MLAPREQAVVDEDPEALEPLLGAGDGLAGAGRATGLRFGGE